MDVEKLKEKCDKMEVDFFHVVTFQCRNCEAIWTPELQEGGVFSRSQYHCPHQCNLDNDPYFSLNP